MFNHLVNCIYFCFKKQCLKELKQDYLEKENRYKSLASVNDMQTKLEELQRQMAWTLVSSYFFKYNIIPHLSCDGCLNCSSNKCKFIYTGC